MVVEQMKQTQMKLMRHIWFKIVRRFSQAIKAFVAITTVSLVDRFKTRRVNQEHWVRPSENISGVRESLLILIANTKKRLNFIFTGREVFKKVIFFVIFYDVM